MNAYLFFDPRARPLSIAGAILPGMTLSFFVTGTTTPTPVYANIGLSVSLGTVVTADQDGNFPPIYLSPAVTYRVQMRDQFGVLLPNGDVDPLAARPDSPAGTVMWFHGTAVARDAAYPPALWQVLDGNNGTPDGRDRFPIIAGGALLSGALGGSVGGTVVSSAAGAHNHGGVTGSTVLNSTNMPVHNHRLYVRTSSHLKGNTRGFGFAGCAGLEGQDIVEAPFGYTDTASAGGGGNKLVEDTGAGSPAGHTHTVTAAVDHTHNVNINPPYVALWALMRRS